MMTSFGVFDLANRFTPDLLTKCPVSFAVSTAAASSASCCAAAITSALVVKANGLSRLLTSGVEKAAELDRPPSFGPFASPQVPLPLRKGIVIHGKRCHHLSRRST